MRQRGQFYAVAISRLTPTSAGPVAGVGRHLKRACFRANSRDYDLLVLVNNALILLDVPPVYKRYNKSEPKMKETPGKK